MKLRVLARREAQGAGCREQGARGGGSKGRGSRVQQQGIKECKLPAGETEWAPFH